MAINLGADDNGGFGNAFQRQFKRSIGVGGEPSMIEPKRVTQDNGPNPLRRDWNGWQEQGAMSPQEQYNFQRDKSGRNPDHGPKGGWNGWQEQGDQMEGGPFGGAGGPMPIPDGGPNWRGTTGGFDPVGPGGGLGGPQPWTKPVGPSNPWDNDNEYMAQFRNQMDTHSFDANGKLVWGEKRQPSADDYARWRASRGNSGGGLYTNETPNGSGAGGPMPIPDRDGGGFGGAGGPMPRGPNPRPYAPPPGAVPMDRGPGLPQSYYLQNHPNNPNSKYAQWKASQQQAQPVPGNTGIVPPHRQDGNGGRILGGPFGPPHPQGGPQIPQQPGGFNFADRMQGLPQNGWNWGELGNIRNRRF